MSDSQYPLLLLQQISPFYTDNQLDLAPYYTDS